MIRRLLCLVLLVTLAASAGAMSPRRVGNFASLMDALTKGATVRVVLEYGRCNLIDGGNPQFSPPHMGGLTVEAWRSEVDGSPGREGVAVYVSNDELMAHPRHGIVRRQLELEIHHDDRVMITLRHLEPDTYDIVSTWKLATTFDRGDDGAAAFYRLD